MMLKWLVPMSMLLVTACAAVDDDRAACASCGRGERAPSERLRVPRIKPLEKAAWTEAQRVYLEPFEQTGRLLNVSKTPAHHPDLAHRSHGFALGHIHGESSTLPPRPRGFTHPPPKK